MIMAKVMLVIDEPKNCGELLIWCWELFYH